jgi:hypothetical protein
VTRPGNSVHFASLPSRLHFVGVLLCPPIIESCFLETQLCLFDSSMPLRQIRVTAKQGDMITSVFSCCFSAFTRLQWQIQSQTTLVKPQYPSSRRIPLYWAIVLLRLWIPQQYRMIVPLGMRPKLSRLMVFVCRYRKTSVRVLRFPQKHDSLD